MICVAFEQDPRIMPGFHVSRRGNSIDAYLFIRRLAHKYGRVPIYTDGAGWYSDACRWAGVEHVVYGHPLKNLMERMVQYVKDRTEAFDDLFPVGGRRLSSRRAFERMLNWLSAFMFMHNFIFENRNLKRPPLVWREEEMPWWLNEMRRMLRL